MAGQTKLRREFCREMGWELSKDGRIVTGADGRVLVDGIKAYVNGYLDGLHDGLKGTPWSRAGKGAG